MTGYIVPDNPSPTARIVRLICVPPDALWQANIEGALSELRKFYNWNNDDLTADAAVETANKVYFEFIGEDGDCVTILCEALVACIENDPAVAAALADLIINNATIQQALTQSTTTILNGTQAPLSASSRANNLVPFDALCTDGNKYAMALEVVRALNRASEDFFQLVEVITNPAEYAAVLVDNTDITGIPGSILETAVWLQNTIAENYIGAYTAVTEEQAACEIYCAFDNCDLTFDAIYKSYKDVSGISLPDTNSLPDTLDFLINVFQNTEIITVASMHLLILSFLRFGNSFLNIGGWSIVTLALESAKNETLSVPCPACGSTWCYASTNFVADGWGRLLQSGASQPIGTFAACGSETNETTDQNGNVHESASANHVFSSVNMTRVSITIDVTELGTTAEAFLWLTINGINVMNIPGTQVNVLGIKTFEWTGDLAVNTLSVRVETATNPSPPVPGKACITSIEMAGGGLNPFGANNC